MIIFIYFFFPFQAIWNFLCVVSGNEQGEKKINIHASDHRVCMRSCLYFHTIWAGVFLVVMAGVGITVSRSMTEKSQLEITFPYVLSSSVLSACGGHILFFFCPLLSVAPVALGLGAGAGRAGCSRGCAAAVDNARERGQPWKVSAHLLPHRPLPDAGAAGSGTRRPLSPQRVQCPGNCPPRHEGLLSFPQQRGTRRDRSVSGLVVIIHCALFTLCEMKLRNLWCDGMRRLACLFRQKHVHGNEIWTCNANWWCN